MTDTTTDTPFTDKLFTSPVVDSKERFHTLGAARKLSIEVCDDLWEMQRKKVVLPEQLGATERQLLVDQYFAAMWETYQQAQNAAKPEPTITEPMAELLDYEERAFSEKYSDALRAKHQGDFLVMLQRSGLNRHDAEEKLAATALEWDVPLGTVARRSGKLVPAPGKTPRRVELLRAAQLRDFTGGTAPDTKTRDAVKPKPGTENTVTDQGGDDGANNPWGPTHIDPRLGRYSDAAIKRQASFVRMNPTAAAAMAGKFGKKVGDMK